VIGRGTLPRTSVAIETAGASTPPVAGTSEFAVSRGEVQTSNSGSAGAMTIGGGRTVTAGAMEVFQLLLQMSERSVAGNWQVCRL